MLKINFSETPAEERWILHGRLTDPWVDEFRACWKKNHRRDTGRACIVDLNEVTFIDKCGERLLRMLARAGAQFTASGMYTNRILEQITARLGTRRSAPKTSGGKEF
jgi:predicted nucleic acid-binding Zn ribbon protein